MISYAPDARIERSKAQYVVNTVNTVGVMGAGVAKAMKLAHPKIMGPYREACKSGKLQPGTFQLIRVSEAQRVLNLATKQDWRNPSQYDWIGAGLVYMNKFFEQPDRLPASLSMPVPGCGNGGLDARRVQQMIRIYLQKAIANGLELEVCAAEAEAIGDQIYYAGVGSRETPKAILDLMAEIGGTMSEAGYGLRSGGAIGADSAFYNGARQINADLMEIFLPKPRPDIRGGILHLSPVFDRMALNFHPAPDRIRPDPNNPGDKRHSYLRLMARNGNQVFGVDFRNPSNAVICWTEGGQAGGGTGQAIRLAQSAGIPVIDLGKPELQGINAAGVLELAREQIEIFRLARGLPVSVIRSPEPEPC